MPRVIVTGGCGYIGSHTIVELIEAGFEAVSVDDNSRSDERILHGVSRITGRKVTNYRVDLRNPALTDVCFAENRDAVAVIHFAAFKTVPESVTRPLLYYDNNISSLLNVLNCTNRYGIANFIFSSSCSVYGNARALPVTEATPFGEAESPYARTKQMGEQIIGDASEVSPTNFVSLRYFNPVGAHPSCEIGEVPCGEPDNLVPRITRTAIGEYRELTVHGNDYQTRDGTCIRDYVHVSDIARAHVQAITYLQARPDRPRGCHEVFNLGSGTGSTVLEVIRAFEAVSGRKLELRFGPRRTGDVEAVYASNTQAATKLLWNPRLDLQDMMRTAWEWQKRIAAGGGH